MTKSKALIIEYFNKNKKQSNSKLARGIMEAHPEIGLKERALRYRFAQLKEKEAIVQDAQGLKDFEENVKNDSATVSGNYITAKDTDRVKVLEDFLKETKTDLDVWEVKEHSLRAWDVTMKADIHGTGKTYTNYYISVKLVKKTAEFFDAEAFIKSVEEKVKKYSRPVPIRKFEPVPHEGENLLALTINDLHLGRFASARESGYDYSSDIAEKHMFNGLDELLSLANTTVIDKILYYVGHDFFTYDYVRPYAMTSNGTPQETDMRWQDLFDRGEDLQIRAINHLSTIAPVVVQEIPGNHDYQSSYYLGRVLRAVFRDNENVQIDVEPTSRKYFRWGECNIMGSHGKYEKPQDIHAIMMAEDRKNMGDTKYWYAIFGHEHHLKELTVKTGAKVQGLKTSVLTNEDYKGLTITWLPNLAHRDDYEVDRTYVGTIRSAVAMVFNSKKGRTGYFQYNL